MKKTKILGIMSVILIIFTFFTLNTVYAATIGTNSIVNNKSLGDADGKMEDIGSRILTGVSNVGIAISVVIIAFIGIKYMIGSVEEKAEYKKSMMPYFIGAVLVFGASVIGRTVYTIFSKM